VIPSITVTEPDAGSNVRGIRTSACCAEGGWVITGTNHFITFGGIADCLFVLAKTLPAAEGGKHRFTLFLVDKGNPGCSVAGYQQTLAGPPHEQAELVFSDCFVTDDRVLGGEGGELRAVFSTFAEERISMAITDLGTAQRALELATAHARDRRTFGLAIGEFQAIQILLADSATELSAARSLTYELARGLTERTVPPAERPRYSATSSPRHC
jgi:alkylation response protein AidB-like acyl-CoA dehydrogenase